ncbi:prepilin-type N-terminal cleavage/methylation domain-containing protein [Deinococcus aerius]|uniref:prepilin-type N-terminal cleavage/methylation domain-containing protein n=1 Tax=Deinococcus aerius TaxID=200253 RepID=UPI000CCC66C0
MQQEHTRSATPKRQGFTLIELLSVVAIISLILFFLFPNIISARAASNNNSAKSLARNAVTRAEIQRSSDNGKPIYTNLTPCAPAIFSELPANVSSCQVRQDENTSYVLVKSSDGAYFQFDGQQLLGPLATAPASW